MNEPRCRTVRLWLQEPSSLGPIDARHMDRHLSHCPDCAAYRQQKAEMDHLLLQGLHRAAGSVSVREAVRRQLLQPEVAPSWRQPPLFPGLIRSAARPVLVLASVAVVAVLLSFFLPQMLSKKTEVTPASAAWHLRRPFIGYPLTLDPRRPNHLLVGAWGQIYESWNGGDSWHRLGELPSGLVIRDQAVDVAHPHRYLVAALHSVYVSEDSGQHWRQTAANLLGAENMFLMQDQHRPSTFYVGPSVLWTSSDGGRTWRRDGAGTVFAPNGIQALAIARNGDLFTGIWGGGVAVSRDQGVTWQRRERGLARNVLSVNLGSGSRLWAATDRGIFLSQDGGAQWERRSPPHLFTTSIVDAGRYLVAGGDGALYRSTDHGRHWSLATDGLPLDPYVYGLTLDASHPGRVYASLNGDGIFRSDDGGQHWRAVVAGLPISLQEGKPALLLFRRQGTLWKSDLRGADPGNLTVDEGVRVAALSPDGAAAAYVTADGSTWSLRVVSAGGSLAHTLITGKGTGPRHLYWSPDASHIAVVEPSGEVTVTDMSARRVSWRITPRTRLLGWSHDGRNLLIWDARSHKVVAHSAKAEHLTAVWPDMYPSPPVLSADGLFLAATRGSDLWIGPAGAPLDRVASAPSCSPTSWSGDSTRLLLACKSGVEIRDARGRLITRAPVPANAVWAPGSTRALLYFQGGDLWEWSPGAGARVLVHDADPV